MNLVQRVFDNNQGNREHAFLTISYAIATASTKAKRMKIFNDLLGLLDQETEELKSFKTGNIVCSCGNSIDPEENQTLCDDCLAYQQQ